MENNNFKKAESEIIKAESALSNLIKFGGVDFFEKYEEAWEYFLNRIQRFRNKLYQSGKKLKGFIQWYQNHEKERKNDELLNYLFHARNADEHTLQPSLSDFKGDVKIEFSIKSRFYGKPLIKDSRGNSYIPVGEEIQFFFIEPSRKLLPVVDSGVKYDAPSKHLGVNLNNNDPVEISKNGLDYYKKLLLEARRLFIT